MHTSVRHPEPRTGTSLWPVQSQGKTFAVTRHCTCLGLILNCKLLYQTEKSPREGDLVCLTKASSDPVACCYDALQASGELSAFQRTVTPPKCPFLLAPSSEDGFHFFNKHLLGYHPGEWRHRMAPRILLPCRQERSENFKYNTRG